MKISPRDQSLFPLRSPRCLSGLRTRKVKSVSKQRGDHRQTECLCHLKITDPQFLKEGLSNKFAPKEVSLVFESIGTVKYVCLLCLQKSENFLSHSSYVQPYHCHLVLCQSDMYYDKMQGCRQGTQRTGARLRVKILKKYFFC